MALTALTALTAPLAQQCLETLETLEAVGKVSNKTPGDQEYISEGPIGPGTPWLP